MPPHQLVDIGHLTDHLLWTGPSGPITCQPMFVVPPELPQCMLGVAPPELPLQPPPGLENVVPEARPAAPDCSSVPRSRLASMSTSSPHSMASDSSESGHDDYLPASEKVRMAVTWLGEVSGLEHPKGKYGGSLAAAAETEVAVRDCEGSKANTVRRCHGSFVFNVRTRDVREFQLVPRVIGRNGANMKRVAEACNVRIRIRGRGSGFKEDRTLSEADIPLQMALSADDPAEYAMAKEMLTAELDAMALRFKKYCKQRKQDPPASFYSAKDGA